METFKRRERERERMMEFHREYKDSFTMESAPVKFNHRPTKIAISSKCRVYIYIYVCVCTGARGANSKNVGRFSAKEKQPWRKSVAQTVAPSIRFTPVKRKREDRRVFSDSSRRKGEHEE